MPAASRAVKVNVLRPSASAIADTLQLLVPLAVPLPPLLFSQTTWVTPTLSEAVPVTINVALSVT